MKPWIGLGLLILTLLISCLEGHAAQRETISLGICSTITPFMWKDGKSATELQLDDKERQRWAFLQANLDQIPAWGGKWNIVVVRQWLDGENNFARLHRIIEEHEKRGLEVVFRVIEEPEVYGRLQNSDSPEYGYDPVYYRWVQALARAFGGKVRYFLIGNESELDLGDSYHWKENAPKHLRLTYDQYSRVLRTAVKAIKTVNPELQVANCGFSDKSLALAVAQELLDKHGIDDAQRFWEDWKGIGGIKAEGKIGLYRLLKDGDVQRRIDFVRRAARESMGSDLFQLHYYGGWQAMQPMLDWVHKEMREGKEERPMIAAEVGYRIHTSKRKGDDGKIRLEPDWDYYSEDEHAGNIVKNFTILFSNGVKMALYWSMRESSDSGLALKLFRPTTEADVFIDNRASRAFRMLGTTLNNARSSQASLPAHPGLREFRVAGASDVSLVWSESDSMSAFMQGAAQVLDIEGNKVSMADGAKPLAGPLYLFWPSGISAQTSSKDSTKIAQ